MERENTPTNFQIPLTRTEMEAWMPAHIRRRSLDSEKLSKPVRVQVLIYHGLDLLPREAVFSLEPDKTVRAFWGTLRGEG